METKEITNEQKQKMISILEKLQEGMEELEELWSSDDDSGITPFDKILGNNFPFGDPFFFGCDFKRWTSDSITDLKNL